MLKFAKIFICTIVMVAILAVPCFAMNEGTYGHTVSVGTYRFKDVLNLSMLPDGNHTFDLEFISNGVQFNEININKTYNGILVDFSYYSDDSSYRVYYRGADGSQEWIDADYQVIEIVNPNMIYDSMFYSFFVTNIIRLNGDYQSFLLDDILSTFVFVGQWITEASEGLIAMFWVDNSLTFVGTLAIAALALAVSFLLIGLIQRFLKFKS